MYVLSMSSRNFSVLEASADVGADVGFTNASTSFSNAPINVMPEGGGPRDRVGTLIRNKNLESNFLTLGIRFQFKVPHLGEGLACVVSIPVRF